MAENEGDYLYCWSRFYGHKVLHFDDLASAIKAWILDHETGLAFSPGILKPSDRTVYLGTEMFTTNFIKKRLFQPYGFEVEDWKFLRISIDWEAWDSEEEVKWFEKELEL